MGYDGYSAAHHAKTLTDLLLVPCLLRSRGYCVAAAVDMRIAVAPGTQLNAPMMESQSPSWVWPRWRSWGVARPVEACTAQQMQDLRMRS